MSEIKAVVFDFGGVFTDSPFTAVVEFGAELGLDPRRVTDIVFGAYENDGDHPWHQLERGEISLDTARVLIMERGRSEGHEVDIFGLFAKMAANNAGADQRRPLVEMVEKLRSRGLITGIVTNNVKEFGDGWRGLIPVDELFDWVIDSSNVGVRKPDPQIFMLALEQLNGLQAEEVLFLDDYTANLDAAGQLGINTLLVDTDIDAVIASLEKLTTSHAGS